MTRIDRLKFESKKSNEEQMTGKDSGKLNNCDNTHNKSDKIQKKKVENEQVAEEKAAADLFPLNLISNRFKNADSESLKGKPYMLRVVTLGF